jgi:16S rRNA (cytidine1402-2'-O)-methyltransferase
MIEIGNMLYVVATPIGNMSDITLRAIETLKQVDFIIAENPGHTQKLLSQYKTGKKELLQFAEHNELRMLDRLISKLQDSNGALVSDAGTPGISDPGFRLVRACIAAGITVIPVPGASAGVAALSGSGLPTDRFLFVGFLPKTEPKLLKILADAEKLETTLIGYESPQRLLKTLGYISNHNPECAVVVARELTKVHESFTRGTATEVLTAVAGMQSIRGEVVLLVSFKK